ncbi:hypothetical protein Btru_045538 [Bulinus truncatus]|nr:hypothetical protein Btru_045538 [Bulinus truncatus]
MEHAFANKALKVHYVTMISMSVTCQTLVLPILSVLTVMVATHVTVLQQVPISAVSVFLDDMQRRSQTVVKSFIGPPYYDPYMNVTSVLLSYRDLTNRMEIFFAMAVAQGNLDTDPFIIHLLQTFQNSKIVKVDQLNFEIDSVKIYDSLWKAEHDLYPTNKCKPGYYFRLDKQSCEHCPSDMYWSELDNSCHVCPYTLFNSTSCLEGEWRTVSNPLINIEVNVTMWTPKCMKNDYQYFNNIDEKELVRHIVVSSQDSYYYAKLCLSDVGCENIITNYVGQEICIPDPACTANATCTSYHTRIHLGVYHIGTYLSERNRHDLSSVDILMRILYNTTQLYQWIPLMNYQAIRIVQPYDIKITSIEDVTKQVLYITNLYNEAYNPYEIQIFNTIFESIPEFIRAYFVTIYNNQYGTALIINEIWLRKDVDDVLIEKIAKAMVLSHVNLGGILKGPLLLYKTIQDREDGKMAVNWKDVINGLSVAQYFCNGGNFITSDNGNMNFACVDTCGNWTWGENCTENCNCTKETTVTCEKWQGLCICAPNFEGSSCEKLIDHCLLYSACGPNSECINTMTSYECKCHEGYKNNPYNPNICEACTGLTFGTECNSTCSCHAENTQFCDNVSGNCTCKSGFQSASCDVDINECEETVSPCSENLHCYNTYGSYLCAENFGESQFALSIYLRLTLMQGDLTAQSKQIIYSLQQIIQTWFDEYYYYYNYRYLVTSYDIQHSMSSTSIFLNVITVYGSQYIDSMLQHFIYNYFVISTLRITVNGTDYEISSFKVYKTPEDARRDINPRIYKICQSFGICSSDSTCLNTDFLPICQALVCACLLEKCDYGMYAENQHCVACEQGKSTLVKGANSRHYCTEICLPGYYFRLDKMTCEFCPNDTYWSEADRSCHICPYTIFNATSCTEGEVRTVNNPLINIEVNVTIRTPRCMKNDSQYFNNIDERELVRLMVSSQSYYYSRLCIPYVGCDNIITNYVGQEICIPDPSCTANATCTSYHTRIHLAVYHIGTFSSSVSERNSHDQSSVDILMRTLYDTTQLYQWIPLMNYQAIRIVQPYDIKITSIEDVTKQVLYITHVHSYPYYTDQLQIYNTIFQTVPEFIRAYFLTNQFNQYGSFVSTYYEIWLRKDVDDLLIGKIAKAMVLSHVNLGGNLNGPLLLYKTIQDREAGKMAINWKDVINSLSVAQYFCTGGNFITSDYGNMNFACVDTCGNWTWGENCTEKCNCTRETTVTCEKWQGSCICAPNFEGSSCEKLIDHCLLYSACGPNSECINTMTSYECKCHEGYKNNPYNPNICEACTGLTFGTECNSTCSCHAENTQFCDNVSGNCTCKSGFQSASCDVDINECKETVSPCSENLYCYNTYGSYLCAENFGESQFALSIYLRLTLMQGDLIAQSEQIIYSLQQIIQSWFESQYNYYASYRYLVTSYDIQHSMSSTSIFFNVISVYGSQSIDSFLQQFIYNHFIISTLRITVNGTDYEISSFKVYETPEEARLDINPRKKCDYGMYAENQHCVACEQGKSTLVKGANSRHYCTEICLPGYYFRLDKMTCEFCPNDTYWSEADRSCHICPYTIFNATSCTEGEVRTVNNPLINIEVNVTIMTPKCMKNDSQYFNNIDERELVRLMVSSQGNYYSRLCTPYVGCDNIITNYVGQEICIPDPSCTANTTCTSYYTRIHLGVYHIGTYSSSVSDRNNHDQISVDILMRTLYDTTQLYQWIPLMNYQAIRIVQPSDIKIISIEDVTKQVLYITHLYNYHSYIDQLQIYNSIFESIPEFIRAFFLNQHYDQYGRVVSSNYEIWLLKDVDDLLIEKIAKAMVLSHVNLGGNLHGPLLLYKTIQEREAGKMAINWKDVINSLSVAQYFCNGGNFITSDYGYMSFACVDTCGNWTWGENCTGKCNCTKETTLTCEKWQGSCICAPNFEGSSCEKLIDHCLLYSACGPNSECINTMTSYECKCHEGYKKIPTILIFVKPALA